jgi:hypothetical protein
MSVVLDLDFPVRQRLLNLIAWIVVAGMLKVIANGC